MWLCLAKPRFLTPWNRLFQVTQCGSQGGPPFRCPFSENFLHGGSSAESLFAVPSVSTSHWSPTPQPVAKFRRSTRARYFYMTQAPFAGCLGSGFPTERRLSQRCTAFSHASFPLLLYFSFPVTGVRPMPCPKDLIDSSCFLSPLLIPRSSLQQSCSSSEEALPFPLLRASWHLLPRESKIIPAFSNHSFVHLHFLSSYSS